MTWYVIHYNRLKAWASREFFEVRELGFGRGILVFFCLVIDVVFDSLVLQIFEDLLHGPLVCCACNFQPDCHDDIAIDSIRCAKCCVLLVTWDCLCLIVPEKVVHKGNPLVSICVVHHDLLNG